MGVTHHLAQSLGWVGWEQGQGPDLLLGRGLARRCVPSPGWRGGHCRGRWLFGGAEFPLWKVECGRGWLQRQGHREAGHVEDAAQPLGHLWRRGPRAGEGSVSGWGGGVQPPLPPPGLTWARILSAGPSLSPMVVRRCSSVSKGSVCPSIPCSLKTWGRDHMVPGLPGFSGGNSQASRPSVCQWEPISLPIPKRLRGMEAPGAACAWSLQKHHCWLLEATGNGRGRTPVPISQVRGEAQVGPLTGAYSPQPDRPPTKLQTSSTVHLLMSSGPAAASPPSIRRPPMAPGGRRRYRPARPARPPSPLRPRCPPACK